MRKPINTTPYLLILLGFISFISCSRFEPETHLLVLNEINSPSNTVSLNIARNKLERLRHSTKSDYDQCDYSIVPYVSNLKDTLMYIVQFEDNSGWVILSSDTRVPPILAESSTGRFSLEEGNPAAAVWLSNMANDMARVRASSDEDLTFSKEEIENNKMEWGISPRSLPGEYSDPYGHWEVSSHSITEVCDTMDHMVAKWTQNSPYNELSPYYVDKPNERAAAGCVAVAGSQMLLYLHNKLGNPSTMFSQGYCVGNTSDYYREFTNATNTVWSQMSMSYQPYSLITLPEAILIGHVGQLVNMHYWENITNFNSWALPGNLQTNVFNYYGINCSRSSYNSDIVKTNLQNQLPVIVSGSNQLIPIDGYIHCFVIDGYKRTRKKYISVKYWVLDVPPPPGYIMPEDEVSVTYTNPEITSIKINWGWSSQWSDYHVNDGWYALTGGWTVNLNNDEFDFNHNLYMTYGFSINNN